MPTLAKSQIHCDEETQTIKVPQKTTTEFEITVKDLSGKPLNLENLTIPTPVPIGGSSSSISSEAVDELEVRLFVRESYTSSTVLIDSIGEVLSEPAGLVRFVIDDEDTRFAGTYTGEVVVKRNSTRLHVMPLFISIEPSQSALMVELSPVLTIAWIRLMLRDTCPEANFLIDELEWDDTEIAFALRHPIDEWNETPPPTGQLTPKTFPFRNHHARAAIAELLLLAGHWYLRNNLSYSAAGVAINDRDKGNAYITLGQNYQKQWRAWMRNKKIELNVDGGFVQLLSPYTFIDAYYGFFGF